MFETPATKFSYFLQAVRSLDKTGKELMYLDIIKLTKLLMLAPALNADSFSTLNRIKNYFRSTMKQDRLGNLMAFSVHQQSVDKLDFITAANLFKQTSVGLSFRKNRSWRSSFIFLCLSLP